MKLSHRQQINMKNPDDSRLTDSAAAGCAPATCSVESVNRQVIENQLLAALDDKSKVAILATEDDLKLLIAALRPMWANSAAREMCDDLCQLKDAAFPPNEKS